ncbi:putative WD repeat-containing protein [Wickerhamomyces ciferrii]|uniref:WD repeat-containing protein n=1 Tax=Wickerhamomyces ciferrii (strain ATCC 14091 / BCRC 22168 / CBS 111 / JCM 3599 / NBRC 0793 / NRRL Y-1031 F-60-10) TaxID=1206466 RepID=K0KSR6_WICCF|nr:putative WD repeat-containing protein [Wickerhamomyces ciferrii]CCH44368.1 putative WD repeat-containing protein [Wickerhamomyces ciferrii]
MVKSYQRYEQLSCFGVISSKSNVIWIPPSNKTSAGQAITAGLEEILIWDVKTGELVKKLRDGLAPGASDSKLGKPAEITFVELHQDTNLLGVGYEDGSIKIWDLISGTVLINFQGHKSAITLLKFDAEGTRLISGSKDSNIIFWDLVGEVGLFKLRSHKDQITGLWFNEEWLVSTSKDGLIKVWDLKTQQSIETHVAHTGECWGLGLIDDILITTGAENQVKVWKLDLSSEDNKLKERGIFEKQSKSRGEEISFNKAGSNTYFYIQNSDRTIEIFRVRTTDEIAKATKKREKRLKEKGHDEEEIEIAIKESEVNMLIQPFTVLRSIYKVKSATWASTNSSKLELLVSSSNNTLEYYTIAYTNKEVSPPVKSYTVELQGHRTDIRSLDISDNNKLLATASNGLLKIWNTKTNNCIRTFECGYALTTKFLPGGSLIVVGTKTGEVELYDLASSTLLDTIEAHEGAIWSLDLTPDGRSMVTGSQDKTVKFWNFKIEDEVTPGTVVKSSRMKIFHDKTLELNDDILALKISPDKKYLAVSLLDNTVKVFFYDTLKFYLSLYGHKLPVLSLDIADDSKLIITSSADKNIKIWGLDFGDCHKSIFGHQDSIMNVKFLPDSHNFFSAGKDGLLKYWDGDKFECIQKLSAHQSQIWSIAVATDGSFVVSTSHDHSIRIWEETEDQVFIEEEKEKEMDELYENTLLSSLEGEDEVKKDDDEEEEKDEATGVNQQTLETLKAGEKLLEALEIGYKDIEEEEKYQAEYKKWLKTKAGDQPIKPTKDALLQAMNKSGSDHILETLLKIRPSQLEDALLVLPFSFVLKFFKIIERWTKTNAILRQHLAIICRVLFFLIRSNLHELNSMRDEGTKRQITNVKSQLRAQLKENSSELGFNIQGLRFLQNQWNLTHNTEFIDEYENREQVDKQSKKRVYQTL